MFKKIFEFLKNIFYKSPKVLFINFYGLILRKKIFNIKRLPADGPAILAINHTTGADPIIILASLKKKIIFLADSKCFETRITNIFFRKFTNSIPVFKKQFMKNIQSFKEIFNVFNIAKNKDRKKNIFLGIFPEGKLNKENKLNEFFKGAAYLSYKMKLPIIPVYMSNVFKGSSKRNWLIKRPVIEGLLTIFFNAFKKIHIFIGNPIDPIADNIIKDFDDLTDKNTYKSIIKEINSALNKEFFKLEIEAKLCMGKLSPASLPYNITEKELSSYHIHIPLENSIKEKNEASCKQG